MQIDQPAGYGTIDPADWNALEARTGPFMDWRFLELLEKSGCVGGDSGWHPAPIVLRDASGTLKAAAPGWLKQHSHGEFVFDWNWARAAQQAGLGWYPKLLIASPFSPVPGPRLLGCNGNAERALELAQASEALMIKSRLSSVGVNFCSQWEQQQLVDAGWLARQDWQFHWHNRGYRDFQDYLDTLKRKPRKNIRAERRKVSEQGWSFEWKTGQELNEADIDLAYRCYLSTFALYGNVPMLNRAFFQGCAEAFGTDFLVCVARRAGRNRAATIFWRDEQRLYGRYWGALEDCQDVHFEACYYQGIDYCIRHGLAAFEPGAQGEHKIRRGFLPTATHSAHLIAHPGMRAAIARYLVAEHQAVQQYGQQLERLNPYGEPTPANRRSDSPHG